MYKIALVIVVSLSVVLMGACAKQNINASAVTYASSKNHWFKNARVRCASQRWPYFYFRNC
jgi:hypothetical protein